MANATMTTVQFIYKRVIDETIKNSRETFLNEGIEESVLQELKTLWESKVSATRAVEPAINPPDYIPRGQINRYNYRNQPQQNPIQVTQPQNINVPFPGHLSAFIPQQVQGQNMGQRPQTARPSIITGTPSVRPNIHSTNTNMRPNIHSGAPSVRPNIHSGAPSVRPNVRQNMGGGNSSQYANNIPFPSLSGVTTVTKNEFNNASDSIQVDGCMEALALEDCSLARETATDISVTKPDSDATTGPSQIDDEKPGPSGYIAPVTQKIKKYSKRRLKKLPNDVEIVLQLDGGIDSDDDPGEFVDSEESEDDDNDDTDEEIDVGGERNSGYDLNDIKEPSTPVEEDDPLNSEDDDSDDAGNTEFEATDNVVVCLFEKVTRSKNKWKLNLKEGIMNIGGKDHVFHKAIGDGEW